MRAVGYLVIRRPKGSGYQAKIVRATQRRPYLDVDEAMVKIALDLPNDIYDSPVVIVPVEPQDIAVAVEVVGEIEEDD